MITSISLAVRFLPMSSDARQRCRANGFRGMPSRSPNLSDTSKQTPFTFSNILKIRNWG